MDDVENKRSLSEVTLYKILYNKYIFISSEVNF